MADFRMSRIPEAKGERQKTKGKKQKTKKVNKM
jgi:hypothetical protein